MLWASRPMSFADVVGEMPVLRARLDLAQFRAQRIHLARYPVRNVALQVLAQVDERLGNLGHRVGRGAESRCGLRCRHARGRCRFAVSCTFGGCAFTTGIERALALADFCERIRPGFRPHVSRFGKVCRQRSRSAAAGCCLGSRLPSPISPSMRASSPSIVRFSASSDALSECRGILDRDPFIFLLASSARDPRQGQAIGLRDRSPESRLLDFSRLERRSGTPSKRET